MSIRTMQTRRTRPTRRHFYLAVFVSLVSVVFGNSSRAVAETRWAVIISGASGGEKYAEQMATWRSDLRSAMVDRYQFKAEHVRLLVDEAAKSGERASAENVR